MKSFDDIIKGKVNEGLYDKWAGKHNDDLTQIMLLDIMKKLDEIYDDVHREEGESSGEN